MLNLKDWANDFFGKDLEEHREYMTRRIDLLEKRLIQIFKRKDTSVTITIPKAKVLDQKVDPESLTKESFIVDKNSASIKAEDETKAFSEAEKNMFLAASEDTALLASAQQRAQILIEEYIKNIGKALGKEYSIQWRYIDSKSTAPTNITETPTASS